MRHLKFDYFLKKHTKSHWILLEYLSESIEPPKNLQLLKFSRYVKGSLFILENIRNKKNCTFSGEKYAKFFHSTSLIPSRLPQQVIYHLSKSQLKQDESLINNLHFKKKFTKIGQLFQKLQQLMPFFIRNPTLWFGSLFEDFLFVLYGREMLFVDMISWYLKSCQNLNVYRVLTLKKSTLQNDYIARQIDNLVPRFWGDIIFVKPTKKIKEPLKKEQ